MPRGNGKEAAGRDMRHDPRALLRLEDELRAAGRVHIAGVDEAGRGALAGPVVAAAVVMGPGVLIRGVADSKALKPARREELAAVIWREAVAWGVGIISAAVVDRVNILRATHLAMRVALESLEPAADMIIVDGLPVPGLPGPSRAVVDGDRLCHAVAAASIIAKVTRDQIMRDLERLYPGYGLAAHKGYGTAEHCEALAALGPCPVHRLTFEPLRSRAQGVLEF
jgi:ribonuclease HII